MKSPMILNYGSTHIGQRKVNEDFFLVDESLGLYIVADGVGGLSKGEVASQLTCKTIREQIKNGATLVEAVEAAHKRILIEVANNNQKKGMASTVVAVLLKDNVYEIAWVGDSRVYLWDGELKLLTRDHSYVELLLETGHITYDQLRTHPEKNVISQALGIVRKDISVACNKGTLEKNQFLFLATDGLYEIAQEKIILSEINDYIDIQSMTQNLIDYAVQEKGKDNITLLTLKSLYNSIDVDEILKAKVVRSFDNETGEVIERYLATKVKEDYKEFDAEPKKLNVKSVAPKLLEDIEEKQNKESHIIEVSMLILIIIAILIIVTLNL